MTKSKRCSSKRVTALNWQAVSRALIGTLALALSLNSSAQLYEYTDPSGRRVFVDRLSAVPLQFRDQLILRDEVVATPQQRAETQRLRQINEMQIALRRIEQLLNKASSPIHFANNQVIVPVEITQGNRTRELSLLLDTGANRTVFHRSAVAGLVAQDRLIGGAQTASGELISLYQSTVDRLQIGPFEIAPAQVQLLDYQGSAAHQGLLGMDLLAQVQYQLDLEAGVLQWAPAQIAELNAQRERLVELIRSQSEPEP